MSSMASSSFRRSEQRRPSVRAILAPPATAEHVPNASKPIKRTLLDLDSRIFPMGIRPGSVLEIRGPEGSGKTFLTTYLIARLLFLYPDKSVALIDTKHHFSLENLISILSHLDPAVLGCAQELSAAQTCPNIRLFSYLNRFCLIECHTAEQFLLNFGPGNHCPLETFLHSNIPPIGLLIVDAIDSFAYVSSLSGPTSQLPNILLTVLKAVEKSKTPLLCVLTQNFNGAPKPSPTSASCQSPLLPRDRDSITTVRIGPRKISSTFEPNMILESRQFTHSLQLCPLPKIEPTQEILTKMDANSISVPATRMECIAYLKSKHGLNTGPSSAPGSAGSHRLKFSVFSGMLWICDEEPPAT